MSIQHLLKRQFLNFRRRHLSLTTADNVLKIKNICSGGSTKASTVVHQWNFRSTKYRCPVY